MAKQAVNFVASAVTSELTSRVFSGLIQRYGKDAATREKLQRLEMHLIMFHSAIVASEMRTIKNLWLLQWREKLKEATSQGDKVLASFRRRVKDTQDTSNTNNSSQQQCKAVSYSAPAPSGDEGLSFTRNSVSNMLQGICNARQMLFLSIDDDVERLNRILKSLEMLSLNISEFIRLLHLEALLKEDQAAYGTAPSTKVHGPLKDETREKKRMKISTTHSNPSSPLKDEKTEETSEDDFCSDTDSDNDELTLVTYSDVSPKKRQFKRLQVWLGRAFTEICKAVELADGHDLEDLEWLAYWAGILREAKEQVHDVLGTTRACKTVNTKDTKEPAVECDQEEDELGTFVRRIEVLARDVGYFKKLVYLCPAR